MFLHTYAEYLATLPRTSERSGVLRAIQDGRASLGHSQLISLRQALRIAALDYEVIADLRLLVLRNRTELPFVMGDTPCLASNHYMREVRNVGVLGMAQRGLMLSMPLNRETHVLLLDSGVYRAPGFAHGVVDVSDPDDVEVLNSLQVLGAQECVYFAKLEDGELLAEFVRGRPLAAADHEGGFRVLRPVDGARHGVPQGAEMMLMYEPQLPTTLSLSFVSTPALPPRVDLHVPRRPRVVDRLQKMHGIGESGAPIPIDDLVRWVEADLVISPS